MDDSVEDTPRADNPLSSQSDEDCGCSGSRQSHSTPQSASRRVFLKAVSTAAIGIAAAPLASSAHSVNAAVANQSVKPPEAAPIDLVQKALAIAKADAMYQQALGEVAGFEIDEDAANAKFTSSQGASVGLVLQNRTSSSPRLGANVVLTVDLASNALNVVQYLVGWCLHDRLQVMSTIFDTRWALYPEITDPRNLEGKPSPLKRPRRVQEWTFLRPDSPPLRKEEMVEVGWPEETAETCYWHHLGCGDAAWTTVDKVDIYRCLVIVEQQSCKPDQQRRLDLTYPITEKA